MLTIEYNKNLKNDISWILENKEMQSWKITEDEIHDRLIEEKIYGNYTVNEDFFNA